MRQHLPRPAAPHRAVASGATAERSLAQMWLGAGHPLVQSLSRSETACKQLVTVFAQGVLVCRIALLRNGRRDLCLELVVRGGPRLPLACVERLRRDLLDRRALGRLASSIDELVRVAGQPGPRSQLIHPLADRRVVRAVAPDLREVASLLRGDPAVQGVALVEWLLTSPATPLYGSEIEPLRAELRRARYLMTHA